MFYLVVLEPLADNPAYSDRHHAGSSNDNIAFALSYSVTKALS